MRVLDELTRALAQGPAAAAELGRAWGLDPTDGTDPSSHGLRFYAQAARRRRRGFVRHVYPRLFEALLPHDADALMAAYLARPPGSHPDWFRNAEALVATAQALADGGMLPGAAPELADHEWTLFDVGTCDEAPAEAVAGQPVAPNPTLVVRQATYDWPAWLGKALPLTEVQPAEVRLVYYLQPTTLQPRWRPLDDATLAALKIAEDGIGTGDAARALGLPVEQVEALLSAAIDAGLLTRRQPGHGPAGGQERVRCRSGERQRAPSTDPDGSSSAR